MFTCADATNLVRLRHCRASQAATRLARRCGALAIVMLVAVPAARGATLSSLLSGGSLTVGAAQFTNWQLTSLDATAATQPNLALITVDPLAGNLLLPGLRFSGNGQWATTAINTVDMTVSFHVQATSGSSSFTGQQLTMTGAAFGPSGGIIAITNEAIAGDGADLGAVIAFANVTGNALQFSDAKSLGPRLSFTAYLNILVTGAGALDQVDLSAFEMRLTQIGPTLLQGDFNGDNRVDGGDFLQWQRGQSPMPKSTSDLDLWKQDYGLSIAVVPVATTVPEPPAALLAVAAMLATRRRGRRNR